MPRANRHFISGHAWHITHRCHQQDFLLKFAKDRSNWVKWLYEAKKRYGLCVLNYIVTSNHICLWCDSVAVGSERYVENIQAALGTRAKGRKCQSENDHYILKEPEAAYGVRFTSKMDALSD